MYMWGVGMHRILNLTMFCICQSFTAHTHTHTRTHAHARTHLSVCLFEGLPAMFSTLRLLVSVPEDDNRCCTWQGRQTH